MTNARQVHAGSAICFISIVMLFLPGVVSGQTMSFSDYNVASLSSDTVFGTVTEYDNSSGCNHGDYYTYASLSYSGGGGTGWVGASGLNSSANMGFVDDGDYSVTGYSTFFCDCAQGYIAGSGGTSEVINITKYSAPLQYSHYNSLISKHEYHQNPAICTGACQPPKFCSVTQSNWVLVEGYRANTGYATYCAPRNVSYRTIQPACVMHFSAYLGGFNDQCS